MRARGVAGLVAVVLTTLTFHVGAQGRADVLRGRVTDTHGHPVADAAVTITGGTTQTIRTVHSDSGGRFAAVFVEPEGSYSLLVRKPGYSPALKRVSRGRGTTGPIDADMILGASAYPLPPLTVRVSRPNTPTRPEKPSIGGPLRWIGYCSMLRRRTGSRQNDAALPPPERLAQ
jgi:hypothetical protein